MRKSRFLIAAILLQQCVAGAWDNQALRARPVASSVYPFQSVHRRMTELESALAGNRFDPSAESILAAAELFSRKVMPLTDLRRVGAAAYRTGGEDRLIAKWTQTGGATVLLDETPYLSDYYIRSRFVPIRNQKDLFRLLSGIISWATPPLLLTPGNGLSFDTRLLQGQILEFAGGATFRSSFASGANIGIFGASDGNVWEVYISIPKIYTASDNPVPPNVPERFPPLRELARTWSSNRIMAELGKTAETARDAGRARDTSLMEELLNRGVSEDEFLAILIPSDSLRLHDRVLSVMDAITDAGNPELVVRYFPSALRAYSKFPRAIAEEAVRTLFLPRSGDPCPQEFEPEALNTLKSGRFFDGPLRYLARCSASPKTLETIKGLSVPIDKRAQLEMTINTIRHRLESPTSPRKGKKRQ